MIVSSEISIDKVQSKSMMTRIGNKTEGANRARVLNQMPKDQNRLNRVILAQLTPKLF
jgi:hypothetical protein